MLDAAPLSHITICLSVRLVNHSGHRARLAYLARSSPSQIFLLSQLNDVDLQLAAAAPHGT